MHKSKNIFLTILFYFLFATFINAQDVKVSTNYPEYLNTQEIEYIKKKQNIIVSNQIDYEPIDYVINNKPTGYSIDLLKLLLKDTGLKLTFKSDTWTNNYKDFMDGKIDLVHSMYKNKEREMLINFSKGYLRGINSFVIRKESKDISNIKELYGKRVGVTKGWYQEEIVKEHPEIQRVYLTNIEEKLDALYNNKIDAFINNRFVADFYIKKYGYTDLTVSKEFDENINKNDTSFHFGTLKNNEHLISIINKSLQNLPIEEQTKLSRKWFGIEEKNLDLDNENQLEGKLIYALLVIIIILMGLLFFINSKRKSIQIQNDKDLLEKILKHIDDSNSEKSQLFKENFKKYFYSLLILATFVFLSFLVFNYFLNQNNKRGEIINKSGKQRMLSQRLIIKAQERLEDINSNTTIYKNLIINIRKDNQWLNDNIKDDEKRVYEQYEINTKIQNYLRLHEEMLKNPTKDLLQKIKNEGSDLLNFLEKAVSVHKKNYDESIALFEMFKIIESLIGLLLIYLLWIYIYKPNSQRQEALYDAILYEKEKILEIKNEQQNLLSLFDIGDVVLFKWRNNKDWDIEHVSQNVERIFGYKKEEFLNKDIRYDQCIYKDDLLLTNIEVKEAIEKNKEYFRHKPYRIITKYNEIKWILDVTVTQKDKNGNITHFIGYLVDITEQKLLQEELKLNIEQMELINEDLQNKNEELATTEEELRAQQDEIIESQNKILNLSSVKEQFIANMSHEIRTPLNGIIGIVDMLIDHPEKDSFISDKLNILKRSSLILNNIVNDILDFSALQSGKVKLFKKEFSLRTMINHLENTLSKEFKDKDLEFRIDIDEQIEDNLTGDEFRINQILLNLLSNGLKFTNDGYVSLQISQENKDNENIDIKFIIKDTGIGISDDIKQKLFQEFTQGDYSNTKRHKGTGLGLVIVKKLVTLMNGEIYIDSQEDIGTTFSIYLKLPYSKDKNEKFDKKGNLKLLETKKALLAEDDKINQIVLSSYLKKLGFELTIVNNGLEAVNKISQDNSFDIIFMDIQMPIMDGLEACKRIKEFNKNIPIVAISAGVLAENIKESKDAGMDMHIGKPIVPQQMDEVLIRYFKCTNDVKKL